MSNIRNVGDKGYFFIISTRWYGALSVCQLIIDHLVENGYKIIVFGQVDDKYKPYFKENCTLVEINMKRSYFSFGSDLVDLFKLCSMTIKYKPVGIYSLNPCLLYTSPSPRD